MHGSLRDAIGDIRNRIIEFKADIEAGIDFSEEEIDLIQPEKMHRAALDIRGLIEDLQGRCRTGEQLSRGIDITITGKPNVGKSSILNLLLNQERAIVSSIPGTTRDIIREPFQLCGMHVNLVDTAGIDAPGDEIERLGIELTHRNIESSPFIIMVLDAFVGLNEADWSILAKTRNKKRVILINKTDIAKPGDIPRIQREVGEGTIPFSALTGEGLGVLKDEISRRIKNEYVQIENSFIADLRVVVLLDNAAAVTARITSLVAERGPGEIIAFELQALMDILAEITGEITPDDILDSIFSRFCIGK
jgi:tRNA modification GTPase